MKPLVVLLAVFGITLAAIKLSVDDWNYTLSGNIAMSAMLLFTASGHFIFSKGMAMMMPEFIPFKKQMVYITGLIELAAALGLSIPETRHLTGILLIIFFIFIIPANINAAMKSIDYQKADYAGRGKNYLWFRVPLQILFIAWVWWFSVR